MRVYAVEKFQEPLVAADVPAPVPQGSEVLVQVARCGVCHTDLHLQDGFYDIGGGKRLSLIERGVTPPLVMGHEVLGRLIAKGPDAPIGDDAIGRTFLLYPWLGCGDCASCRRGEENLCATPRSLGVFRPGGYAEQCLLPHPRYLVDVTGIDPSLAATYACSGLTAYSALKKATIDREADLLLILGLGGVGMSALQIALALGFRRIAVADLDPAKREAASGMGALLAFDPRDPDAATRLAEAGGVAAAVDFVGNAQTVGFGVATLRKGGMCIVVGLFGGEITLPLPPLVQRAITLRGSFVGTLAELRELVALAQAGEIPPLPVEAVAFEDVNDALSRLRAGHVTGRLVLSRDIG